MTGVSSASGHLQTFPADEARSALPLGTDVGEPTSHVGFGSEANISSLMKIFAVGRSLVLGRF
jgi:hypothetical protein